MIDLLGRERRRRATGHADNNTQNAKSNPAHIFDPHQKSHLKQMKTANQRPQNAVASTA
jgi:hypothetical protein